MKASDSDRRAAIDLGRLSIDRLQGGLKRKQSQVLKYLRRAAATSDAASVRKLAVYVAHIDGALRHETLCTLYQAYQLGDSVAGFLLYLLARGNGNVVTNELSLAVDAQTFGVQCLKRSAWAGCADAQRLFGDHFLARGDPSGVSWLISAAERGDARAMGYLALLYERDGGSVGVEGMDKLVFHCTDLALEANDVGAAGYLAEFFAHDYGHGVDLVTAFRFYRKGSREIEDFSTLRLFGERLWGKGESWIPRSLIWYLRDGLGRRRRRFQVTVEVPEEGEDCVVIRVDDV